MPWGNARLAAADGELVLGGHRAQEGKMYAMEIEKRGPRLITDPVSDRVVNRIGQRS